MEKPLCEKLTNHERQTNKPRVMANFDKTIDKSGQDKTLFHSGDELLTDPGAFQVQMVAALEEWRHKEALSEKLVEGVTLG